MRVSWMGRRLRHFVTFSEVEAERSLFKKRLKAAVCARHRSCGPPRTGPGGLRVDGDMLAGCHGHGASYQARNTRGQNIVLCRGRRGNAHDQVGGRDYAVIGTKHRSSQPSNAVNEVMFRVKAKTAHVVAIRVSWRRRGDRGLYNPIRSFPRHGPPAFDRTPFVP